MINNIYLIKPALLAIALLNSMVQANTNCTGNSCIASFTPSSQNRILPTLKNSSTKVSIQQVESVYREEKKEKKESYLASSRVQIGAFSQYSTAKLYAKRYKLMGDQFTTKISKIEKNGKNIYKVQIVGFENNEEAQQFIAMYSKMGAFLVRR